MELVETEAGLVLESDGLSLRGDFSKMARRISPQNLNGEAIVKASGIKKQAKENPIAVDATAGLGEDSFLLAAAGFKVFMFEKNQLIAELLSDALKRGREDAAISKIIERMHLIKEDSVSGMGNLSFVPDVVLLDPMFPKRTKSGQVKKKLQMIQGLEIPCEDEGALLKAAVNTGADRIIIKRPAKGAFLAGVKPDFSVSGNTIRFDCIINLTLSLD